MGTVQKWKHTKQIEILHISMKTNLSLSSMDAEQHLYHKSHQM
jgi:hypothetical protein